MISATSLNGDGVTEWTPLFYEGRPAQRLCVRYGGNDLAFLTQPWAREGIFFFERLMVDSPEQKLTLYGDVTGLSRAEEFPLNPSASTGAEMECVSMSHYEAHVRPSSMQSRDYILRVSDWPGVYEQRGESLNEQLEQYKIFDYPGKFKDKQHSKDLTLYQVEGPHNDTEKTTEQSNSPKLQSGTRFTLTRRPQKMLNREWQMIQSVLSGDQLQMLHNSQGGGTTLGNQLEMIPADRTQRSRVQSKPEVDRPQSVTVTRPAGGEILCDEHGQVRVKLYWDRYRRITEESSCWMRVSQAWAGLGFGSLAILRVGQEVIVDFLNGDSDQSIIVEQTCHEDNRSPRNLPGTRTQMTIRLKTYKRSESNELRFENATDEGEIYLHAQGDMQVVILNGKNKRVSHDRTVNIGHDEFLVMANGWKVTIEDRRDHRITKGHINLTEDNWGLEVRGDPARKISSALGIDVQGDIVLQSDDKISLRMRDSSVVIHSNGMDVRGAKINLNGGGSPRGVILLMRPMTLKAAVRSGSMFMTHCPKENK